MKADKKKLSTAIAVVLTKWMDEQGSVSVINGNLFWFECSHKDGADLSILTKLGIEQPPYHGEKHWVRGWASFDFFVNQEIYENICNRIESSKAATAASINA